MPAVESAAPPTLPVTHSVLSPTALLDEIARAYALGTPSSCRLVELGLNDTYLLSAAGVPYIVRVYRAGWRSAADVDYELQLLLHLADRSVPVSVPVADAEGLVTRALPASEGTRLMAIFSYAPGVTFHWRTRESSSRAGRLLGAIHAAADEFAGNPARVRLDLDELVDRPLELLAPLLDDRSGARAYLERLASRLRHRVEDLAGALDWGPCHGDFGAANLHVDDGGTLTAFDFDFCADGWRAYDWVIARWHARGQRDDGLWRAFLRGYAEVREVGGPDLAAVPLFDALRHLWSMGLRVRNVAYRGSHALGDSYLAYRLESFRRWEARHGDLL